MCVCWNGTVSADMDLKHGLSHQCHRKDGKQVLPNQYLSKFFFLYVITRGKEISYIYTSDFYSSHKEWTSAWEWISTCMDRKIHRGTIFHCMYGIYTNYILFHILLLNVIRMDDYIMSLICWPNVEKLNVTLFPKSYKFMSCDLVRFVKFSYMCYAQAHFEN